MDSYEVMPNGQIMRIYMVGTNEVKEHYDMFYHVKLTANKTDILSNDIDAATITAKVFNYLGTAVDYIGNISFDVEGERFDLKATAGESLIEITSDYVNQIDVSAWIDNARAGGCVVYAKASIT